MSVAIEMRARVSGHIAAKLRAGLLGLAATAVLLDGCGGSSGGINHSYWRSMYGDPDTSRPDTGRPMCCRHAARDSDH